MPTTRSLMLSILVAALAAPPAMGEDGKIARVGLLGLTEGECGNQSFREGMREMGYTEGRNLIIECRHGGGRYPELQLAAKEVARTRPDAIVALTHITADAAHGATDSIPIVFIASSDPVFGGFAASFPRPGGNMTGLTY
jgi:putative tryptophan/tyrosine transport system substrate-binding protein